MAFVYSCHCIRCYCHFVTTDQHFASLYAAFTPDGIVHVADTTPRASADAELRAFVAFRLDACDKRLAEGTLALFGCMPYAAWSRRMRVGFVRPMSLASWRDMRSHAAILETLRRCTTDVVTLARRTSGIVVLASGERITLDTRTLDRERRNAAARLIAARRIARRYRDAALRNAYRGTVTRDGMALNGTTTRTRLEPLTTALAYSDTLVTRDGITTPIFARGVVRNDSGTVSAADTHSLAVLRARHGKR